MPKRRKAKTKAKTITRYRPGKTVTKWRTRWKKASPKRRKTSRQTVIGGINVGGAVKGLFPMFCGALVCKFAAKKFAEGGSESENWTWKNYGWGLLGTTIAAVGTSAVFRSRGKVAQKVFEGGLLLLAYKIFTNELAPKSQYLESWFGADEDIYPDMSADPGAGDIYQGADDDYVYSADGSYRPVSEMDRLPAVAPTQGIGTTIEPADPTFGYDIEPADPSFGRTLEQTYNEAYSRF